MTVSKILPGANYNKRALRNYKQMTPEQLKKWNELNKIINDELKSIWPKKVKLEAPKPAKYEELYLPNGDIFCMDVMGA